MDKVYDGLFQLQKKFESLQIKGGLVGVYNMLGKMIFSVHMTKNEDDSLILNIFNTEEQLSRMRMLTEYSMKRLHIPTDVQELISFRRGIEITFVRKQALPEKQWKKLENNGYANKRKRLWPLMISFNDEKLLETEVSSKDWQLLTKVIRWLSIERNFALLAEVMKHKNLGAIIPIIRYNQRTRTCDYFGEHVKIKRLQELESFKEFYTSKPDHLQIPELTAYRLLKQIKHQIPMVFEIQLGLSPTHHYREFEKDGPNYVLKIANDKTIMIVAPLEKIDIQEIQTIVLDMCADLSVKPTNWITRGIFAQRLQNILTPITQRLGTPLEIVSVLPVLDRYTFDELFYLILNELDHES